MTRVDFPQAREVDGRVFGPYTKVRRIGPRARAAELVRGRLHRRSGPAGDQGQAVSSEPPSSGSLLTLSWSLAARGSAHRSRFSTSGPVRMQSGSLIQEASVRPFGAP